MIKLVPSTEADIEQLIRWIESDPYHKDYLNPVWWLTGVEGSLLAFRVDDDHGPVGYIRIDREEDICRLHTQFAPREIVAKLRLAKAMFKCIPIVQKFCKQQGSKGVIFQSSNPMLINFMRKKFGFESIGNNDYQVGV